MNNDAAKKELVGIRALIDGEAVILHPDDVEFIYVMQGTPPGQESFAA